jgi:AraC-like DNA-binding protein
VSDPTDSRSPELLANGSLASRRRTVAGVLGQMELVGIPEDEVLATLRIAGLPARALSDPDFPISLDQELVVLSRMLERLRDSQRTCAGFAAETFHRIGINHYGVLGLAMQHAPTVLDALRLMLAYPELSWGHSRVAARATDSEVILSFEMDTPTTDNVDVEALREYCVTVDLVSVERLMGDVLGRRIRPILITLPFAVPDPGFDPDAVLPCPVRLRAPAAEIHYPLSLIDAVPVLAAPRPFQRYEKITRAFSRLLADDVDLADQVTRLLWAYAPAPSREELAAMLDMGTRTLARRLRAEGTSYNALLRRVHRERATNYLRHSSMPVAEIADRMGYSDPAAFTRAFQSWTGESPSRWRARARGGDDGGR